MKTNLELIREKVVEVVPEVVPSKIVPGTRLRHKTDGYECIAVGFPDKYQGIDIDNGYGPIINFKILAHPIQLADVLRAIDKSDARGEWQFTVSPNGQMSIITTSFDGEDEQKLATWNLSLPLDGQSEEALQFLAEILK